VIAPPITCALAAADRHTHQGTGGFGRSDTCAVLRRFFEVDRQHIAVAASHALALNGRIDAVVCGGVRALRHRCRRPYAMAPLTQAGEHRQAHDVVPARRPMLSQGNSSVPASVLLISPEPAPMHPWLMLAIAIAAELGATTALKLSDGFTRPGPSTLVVAGYGLSFYLLAQVLRTQEVGIVYAIWSGAGLAIIALIGVVFLGESLTVYKLAGLSAILIGVVLLNLAGGTQ
jgi:small multidrug resistance pump